MFSSKTLFIIGAGASKEAGLPIGSELTTQIANLLNYHTEHGRVAAGDREIHEAALQAQRSGQQPEFNPSWAGRAVAQGMGLAPSIDTFLHTHSENPAFTLMGKLGIAQSIRFAERDSKMFTGNDADGEFNITDLQGTWYIKLAQQLFSGIPANRPLAAFENTNFIVFNYDRCLERFLVRAVQVYFSLDYSKAKDVVKSLDVIHPYGDLGSIFTEDTDIPLFGGDHCDLLTVSQNIQTFSESLRDDEKVNKIKSLVSSAETVIFLGFSFLPQNMDLLNDGLDKNEKRSQVKRVFATAHNLSASDRQIAREQIASLLKGRPLKANRQDDYTIDILSDTCVNLFTEYERSLSAAPQVSRPRLTTASMIT